MTPLYFVMTVSNTRVMTKTSCTKTNLTRDLEILRAQAHHLWVTGQTAALALVEAEMQRRLEAGR